MFDRPLITLIDENYVPFVFVISPTDLIISNSQNHKPIEIVDLGEVLRDGSRQAIRVSFSGFLPSINSYFYQPKYNPLGAKPSADWLTHAMQNNKKMKLVIPQYLEFLKCKIESFEKEYRDHSGDIYYRITLVEDRESGKSTTVDLVTGLKDRW